MPPIPPTVANVETAIVDDHFLAYMGTTALVALAMSVGQLVFSSFAGYAFARLRFPGRDKLFWAYLATLMVPNIVTLIPLYVITQRLGLSDTFLGLVLPYALGSPFGVFLMRQFFLTLPEDLEAAASLDGAGTFRTFVSVILPLSRSIMATLGLMTLVGGWNNYMWPLIESSSDATRVITVEIASMSSNYGTQIGVMMATALLATAPLTVLYLIFQKQLVQSISITGLK